MKRRDFLQLAAAAVVLPPLLRAAPASAPEVMTVRGLRPAARLAVVLPHEHVLVDFIAAAEVTPARYDVDTVFAKGTNRFSR